MEYENYGLIIKKSKDIENSLILLVDAKEKTDFFELINTAKEKRILSDNNISDLHTIRKIRNKVAHSNKTSSKNELNIFREKSQEIEKIIDTKIKYKEETRRSKENEELAKKLLNNSKGKRNPSTMEIA